jgi:hypothetical protein
LLFSSSPPLVLAVELVFAPLHLCCCILAVALAAVFVLAVVGSPFIENMPGMTIRVDGRDGGQGKTRSYY